MVSLPLAKALLSVPNARASVPPSDFIAAGAGNDPPSRPAWVGLRGGGAVLSAAQMGRSIPGKRLLHGDPALPQPGPQLCWPYLRLEPSCSLLELPVLCPSSGLWSRMPKRVFRSLALEGREEGEHQSAAATPPLAGAAPHGLGGTALAPQLQPLLCSPVCEIIAPHLLFLLPGNRARQRIPPGGLFSPAGFPGRHRHMEYKARRARSSGAGNRAAAECPAGAPPAPRSEPASFPHPAPPGSAPLLPNRWENTAISSCSAEREHLPAARLLPGCCQAALLFGVPLGHQEPVTRPWRGQQRHPSTPCP